MVDPSGTGIELKTTQKSVSGPTTTGGKGDRRNQHKQLVELHSARNQGGNHDEGRKQRTSSTKTRERPRLTTVVGSNGTGMTRLRKTLSHDQLLEFLVHSASTRRLTKYRDQFSLSAMMMVGDSFVPSLDRIDGSRQFCR